jgi:Flp pilus assembly pilin Flp
VKKSFFNERVSIMNALKRFLKDERGLETVEWVVMGCVIVLGVAALVGVLLGQMQTGLEAVGSEIETAAAGPTS